MRRLLRLLPLWFLLFSRAGGAEIPFLAGRVNDQAGILSSSTTSELDALLKQHEDSTSNQVAVLTITSLDGEAIEEYSLRVVDTWKLGQKGKDNGVLLLVAVADRKVRIEVGRGLEGDLPDITCGTIIRKEITPKFKNGDYDGGIRAGVTAILSAIQGSYKAEAQSADASDLPGKLIGGGIFIIVVGIFTVLALFSRGAMSWVLYVFLMPFWFAFPAAFAGITVGLAALGVYAIGFLLLKLWFARSNQGKSFHQRLAKSAGLWSTGSGGWSSGGGGWSSGGGFSGGGGGFSGGGASGSW